MENYLVTIQRKINNSPVYAMVDLSIQPKPSRLNTECLPIPKNKSEKILVRFKRFIQNCIYLRAANFKKVMTNEINTRYSNLAQTDCCLSCGGAISYVSAKKGDVCLDLGSGRGSDVLRLAELVGMEGFVFGVDIADGMLETARSKAQKLGIRNVQFLKSELEKIELKGDSVDWIISNCTINHATDKQSVWNEIHRLLKSGGSAIVSDIYSLDAIPEEYKNDPVAVAECWAGAVTKEEYLDHIQRAGFRDFLILEESKPYQKGAAIVTSITIKCTK